MLDTYLASLGIKPIPAGPSSGVYKHRDYRHADILNIVFNFTQNALEWCLGKVGSYIDNGHLKRTPLKVKIFICRIREKYIQLNSHPILRAFDRKIDSDNIAISLRGRVDAAEDMQGIVNDQLDRLIDEFNEMMEDKE